jgi:hypothetical protein
MFWDKSADRHFERSVVIAEGKRTGQVTRVDHVVLSRPPPRASVAELLFSLQYKLFLAMA